jgi:hypothetical protein
MKRLPFIKSAALFSQLWCLSGFGGQAVAAERATTEGPQVVKLEYQEVSSVLNQVSLKVDTVAPRFKKEPGYGQAEVTRGTLSGGDNAARALPFALARDQKKATLYLDLNHNLDLTDDLDGVFTSPEGPPACTFTNVHLTLATISGSHRYLMDLALFNAPQGDAKQNLMAFGVLRSFWQGKAQLQGQEWQVGVVEDPAAEAAAEETSYLLLRPWAARDEPFGLNPGTPYLVNRARQLCLDKEAYTLECRYEIKSGSPHYLLEFTETHPALGELKVSGASIYRLIFYRGGECAAVLDRPGPVAQLPAGRYDAAEIWLRSGAVEASSIGARRLDIKAGTPATLTIGAPLTNSVKLSRNGGNLLMQYELAGAGGALYRLSGQDDAKRPAWTVFQGDKCLASGKFQFG